MKMKPSINAAICTSLAFASYGQSNNEKTQPNIVYILSDDHTYQAISAYGGALKDYAPTPNIDRIAREGMRLDRCLVTNSISGPCRAVILTGKYSHLNGYIANEGQKPFDGSQQTFPKLLQKAGYTTAIIGKWHLGSDPTGFDHWEILPPARAVDKSVGEVLDFLKENGLDKNTVVIYASDQGFYLGEHGWFDKRWMFEESYRTPLLIKWPGVIKPGSVNYDMVSNIDLPETFLEMAGVNVPADMQGRSMVPILKGKTPSNWRKEHYYHYYEYPGSHMVKRHYGTSTERYKLIHYYYDIDEWELYDRKADPQEMKNVYNDPAYASVRRNLHKRLQKLMKKYGDSEELAKSFLPD